MYFIVCKPEQIVNVGIIEIGELYKNMGGYIPLPELIIAVSLLSAEKVIGYVLLLEIVVFPQIAYSVIYHKNTALDLCK